jgi:hypothetical protein
MQVLCIENHIHTHNPQISVTKGEIYTSIATGAVGLTWRGVDMWHTLEELGKDTVGHVSIFIDLPSEEAQSFKKEEFVEIPQKLQPFYKQL